MVKKKRPIYEAMGPDGRIRVWYVQNLWRHAARLPVVTRTLRQFEPLVDRWLRTAGVVEAYKRTHQVERLTLDSFVECRIQGWHARGGDHLARVRQADLSFPILLSPDRRLIDGYHRFVKAYLSGEDTIRCCEFPALPKPDRIDDRSSASLESFRQECSRSAEWLDDTGLLLPPSAKW